MFYNMDLEYLKQNIQYLSLDTFITFYSEWLNDQVESNDKVELIQTMLIVANQMKEELEQELQQNILWNEIKEGIEESET